MRNRELTVDLLIMLGFVLMGCGLWLAWGWAVTLVFAGTASLAGGLLLALAPRRPS